MAAFTLFVSTLQSACVRAVADHVSVHKKDLDHLPLEVKDELVKLFSKRGLLSDEILAKVIHPGVRELDLTESSTSDEGLKTLRICKQLRKLDLNAVKENRGNITSEGVIAVAQACPNLRTVYMRRCVNIRDNAVAAIAENCQRLTQLNLGGCPEITDESLRTLAKHSKYLQSLDVSRTQITDDGVMSLTNGPCAASLKELHIAHCNEITDDAVEAVLMLCPRVTILIFHGCPLVTDRSRYAMDEVAQRGGVMKQVSWTVY